MVKTQKKILEIIKNEPNISIDKLTDLLKLKYGTVKYHCNKLGLFDKKNNRLIVANSKKVSNSEKIDKSKLKFTHNNEKEFNNTEDIIEETQRESIVNRPHNLAGSVKKVKADRFNITQSKIEYKTSVAVPALLKLFMEAVDNPIDIHIKYNLCNKIDIKVDEKSIRVKDNGIGVSTLKDENDEYILYKAFCKYNTSSNYRENRGVGKGINGIGIKLCTTLSKKFAVTSEDKNGKLKITATENNLNHKTVNLTKTGKTGVEVYFEPDFNIFDVNEIDTEHINRMYEYVLMQSLTYPDIKFSFNGKTVRMKPKQFLNLVSDDYVIDEQEDYFIAVTPSEAGEFRQLSYINGLEVSEGGRHVDAVSEQIVRVIKDKLQRKYKTIKPADIKNKLQIIIVGKNMKDIDWEGQVKNKISSPIQKMKTYFGKTDFEKLAKKIMRNETILNGIVDYFKIKEEFNKKKNLKKLSKKVKIKSEKYLPAIKRNKYLMVAEGFSAVSSIIEPLGRTECGFYSLKGKPLNSYSASTQKFTANKELTELYSIIKNEDYEYVIIASDSDLDGYHIRGLIIGFIYKYMPDYKGKLGILNTPVIVIKNKNKIVNWTYSLKDELKLNAGDSSHYYKGLGTWKAKDLEEVIKLEGLEKMIQILNFDDEADLLIDNWLGDNSEPRKNYIINNDFNIIKL